MLCYICRFLQPWCSSLVWSLIIELLVVFLILFPASYWFGVYTNIRFNDFRRLTLRQGAWKEFVLKLRAARSFGY